MSKPNLPQFSAWLFLRKWYIEGDTKVSEVSYLNEITEEIAQLQKSEAQLARQYGMSGVIDSVEVLMKTKALALSDGKFTRVQKMIRTKLEIPFLVPNCGPIIPHCPPRTSASRFWAILIGIDWYQSSPLRGCVSDAISMEKFLIEVLGVPKNHIQTLHGPQIHTPDVSTLPNRANIIRMLLSLAGNPDIETGDNIIIYYSGHGSCYQCSEYYFDKDSPSTTVSIAGAGSTEALCPMDRDMLDENGVTIPDISDREFNSILTQISRSKGHRITVILDCCHAGSITRGIDEQGVRRVPPLSRASLEEMLVSADRTMKDFPGYRSVLAEDWCPDMDSHVVLAACREYEFAKARRVTREDGTVGFNGIFTESLIGLLKSDTLGEGSTYLDLIDALPRFTFQSPVVAGKRKNTRLWDQD
ncbi:caspase domain-containing protein [Armillaria borealis]|uniref:Caspase domain-containing protein n=1 Tax=Armillaria borealis TaxID=47425 RepID=A0AA39JIB8_9AGAR|nr:caspase domain-containing protein [Armillaria borealis]